jgi:hypothetical protein
MRSATGIRTLSDARDTAESFVRMFGEPFAIIHFKSEGSFDVEPARQTDVLGQWGVVDILVPEAVS